MEEIDRIIQHGRDMYGHWHLCCIGFHYVESNKHRQVHHEINKPANHGGSNNYDNMLHDIDEHVDIVDINNKNLL